MKISIIGSGNVATHLANNFYKKGYEIVNIYSRTFENSQKLAKKVNALSINSITDLNRDVDILIISVSDMVIKNIVEHIDFEPKLVAHTTGSVSINILNKFKNYGVLYPLQTFTKDVYVNMQNTPFCLEANNNKSLLKLKKLASSVSNNIIKLNSEQRLQCHIAAVFANNFTNHMFTIAEDLLKQKNIPFDIIKPLILETVNKIQNHSPKEMQTGPAIRNDKNTIDCHLNALSSINIEKIYSFVSDNIYNFNKYKKDE